MASTEALPLICYKKNFLTNVVAQIQFVSPIEEVKTELPKEISKIALKYFPINEPRPVFQREFQIAPNRDPITKEEKFTDWFFFGRNREKLLKISNDSFVMEYYKYENYETFRDEFFAIATVFFQEIVNAQPSRLGLRFVNRINIDEANPLEWGAYLNPKILGLLSYKMNNAEPTRIFHNYEMVIGEANLKFSFGIHNPDFPAPIRKKQFILDYDAYYKGLIEITELKTMLDQYHGYIQSIFEDSITEGLRGLLNE